MIRSRVQRSPDFPVAPPTLPAARMEPSRSLGVEGLRLCGDGHLRTGITKLRRALRAAQEAGANNATAAMPVVTRNAAR